MNTAPHTAPTLFGLCGAVLLLALLTGGATHSGFYGDVITQLLSIPLLIAALWPAFGDDAACKRKARIALALCTACAIIVFIQILPLPFDVWADRSAVLANGDSTRFGGPHPGWSTISMAPQATWAAGLSLLVPLSVFSSVVRLNLGQRIILCQLTLGVGAVSLMLGFFQVAQGAESPLRFYSFTNPSEAVGFFANRNHFAAFLNVTLVLSGIWLAQAMEASLDRRALGTSSFLWFAAEAAFFVALVAGLAMARSRAGAFLAIAALAGIVLMSLLNSRTSRLKERLGRKTMSRVSLAIVVFAAVFALQVGLGRLLERLENDPADDLRIPLNVTTFETAFKALPFGTGLGSFVPVYATVEKSEDVVAGFVNRAHDDLAEVLLETGLVGATLLVVFLSWFGKRAYAIWTMPSAGDDHREALLNRASTLILALLLFHSLVDYPLRTTGLGALFAFFCAILAVPADAPPRKSPRSSRRGESARFEAPPISVRSDELVWPESWQRRDDN